ncbi:hypothetical protein E2P65_02495 [Candidatus Bathyarchaeota archaeon]|nr:hypothetical protein E2P65_02495 [Candidatus Bathyarchaeota archaeon]
MTILIDDAGYGDLLHGAVIGAYRPETEDFAYDVVDVKYFQKPLFKEQAYREETALIAQRLVKRLNPAEDEKIEICRGDILDKAAADLMEAYGEERVERVKVEGRAQDLIEGAYLDEIRNLGYEPIPDRTEKWSKSFWHMYRWLKANPRMIRYAKTGWPRLSKDNLLRVK